MTLLCRPHGRNCEGWADNPLGARQQPIEQRVLTRQSIEGGIQRSSALLALLKKAGHGGGHTGNQNTSRRSGPNPMRR